MTASLKDQEKRVRDLAKKWLSEGEVKLFIGYERGPNADGARPFFASRPQDTERLVVDETCTQNLTRFLVENPQVKPGVETESGKGAAGAVGIVVKPSGSKALIELAKENIITLERVKPVEIETGEGEENDDPLADPGVEEIEKMSLEDRWAYWKRHLSRCVRCYACREACPLCYCEECVFDRTKPYRWNERSVTLRENLFFHMVRAMHLAGRCIDCMECERACPMNIPLGRLNRFLARQAKVRFGIEPGKRTEDETMFGSYDVDDPGEEIW